MEYSQFFFNNIKDTLSPENKSSSTSVKHEHTGAQKKGCQEKSQHPLYIDGLRVLRMSL